MIETSLAKEILACRRDHRDMVRDGWEYVGERGGNLWELYRGKRRGHRITDARVARDGLGVWIKTAAPNPPAKGGE